MLNKSIAVSGEKFLESSAQKQKIAGACVAHMVHDGYTDQIYAMLPIWQTEFALSYAGLAILRVLYYGTMGVLQVPGNRILGKVSARTALVLATVIAAFGYLVTSLPGGLIILGCGLAIAGIGSSTQHPRASLLVTDTFGKRARGPLGIYNFAGDLGKAIVPALVALALPFFTWRSVTFSIGLIGLLASVVLFVLIPKQTYSSAPVEAKNQKSTQSGKGFNLLLAIGALDTAPRMGYLLFLPFLIRGKGGVEMMVGVSLALLFVGGAFGKAACGWLGERFGIILSVIVTEAATAILMIATLFVPLHAVLIILPLLGVVLNGTSSVLYGTVPDLAPKGDTGRAFALFYTGVIVSGGFAPVLYGVIADHSSRLVGISASALTAGLVIPLVYLLRPRLQNPSL